MESIASTRRVASRVWLEGMASAAVRPCAEAQRRSGTGISHGCERPSCAETQRGNGTGLAWVRASVLRESAAGQWYRSRMGAGVYPCAESLRGSGTGISHGCERSPLRRIAAGQWYRSRMGASVRLARRRSGAMVPASRMGANVHPCAEAQRRNGTGIPHGCECPPLRGSAVGQRYGHFAWVRASVLRESAAAQRYRHLTWVRASVLRGDAAGQWYRYLAWVRASTPTRRRCRAMAPTSHMGAGVRPARKRCGAMESAFRTGANVYPLRGGAASPSFAAARDAP